MSVIRAGTIKRLHVDRHVIGRDRKQGTKSHALTIQTSKGSLKARTAHIKGDSWFFYRPEKPLPCGARAWIETTAEVEFDLL